MDHLGEEMLSSLRSEADQVEVFAVQGESALVSFEANECRAVEFEEMHGLAVRAIVDGRMGFAATTAHVDKDDLMAHLLDSARCGEEALFAFPPRLPAPPLQTSEPALAMLPLAHLLRVGQEIVETLRGADHRASVHIDMEVATERVLLRNTAGAHVEDEFTSCSIGISVERVRGDDVLVLYDGSEDVSAGLGYHEAVQRLVDRLHRAQRSVRLRSGRMPVLFTPSGAQVLLVPLLLAVDGKNVQQGISPLNGRKGQDLLDAKITLWDDPTLPGKPGSSRYDDEGMPCSRKALFDHGVCTTFMLDLRTAALMGDHSTGNGSRDLFSLPYPAPSNVVLQSGDTPLAEILASIEHGLLVDDVLGLDQGNEISGSFSNPLGLAYLVEHGEIVGRVKDASIAGNVYELLHHVAAISQESHWIDDGVKMPYILLPELSVVVGS